MHLQQYGMSLLALLTFDFFQFRTSLQFDRYFTGVTFTPYTKLKIGDQFPSNFEYTAKELQVMLEVIYERFSKVITLGAGYQYNTGTYKRNFTYNNSGLEARISETAAEINRHDGKLSITVLQGMWYHGDHEIETEVQVAIEAVELANNIYPGTVEGLVMSHWLAANKYSTAQAALKFQKVIRNSSVGHLKLGIWMTCDRILGVMLGDDLNTLEKLLLNLNFVICKIDPIHETLTNGPVEAFNSITDTLLNFRRKLKKFNDKLEVMGQVKWASSGKFSWNTVQNMRLYWEAAGNWAKTNSFPIWFFEAIENPKRRDQEDPYGIRSGCGWWKLTDNSKSNKETGYIEKKADEETRLNMTWILTVGLSVTTITGLVLMVAYLHKRGKKLQQQLTKQDIRMFMEGKSDDVTLQQSDGSVDNFALKLPYDKSMDITKKQLKIDHSKLLGIGQFGCLYTAMIETVSGECNHVALKMAKNDCSRTILKSLLSEIKILMYIGKHTNIVAFMGAYTAELEKGIVYIATELCTLGSLQDYLRKNGKLPTFTNYGTAAVPEHGPCHRAVDVQQLIKWSQEIACGMEYLGTKNVVHADLATRNVLLNAEKTAKISDFGLSRRMYDYTTYVKCGLEPLPWRWMAIESLKRNEFSAKSDVWSYGITLWEIFTLGDLPYPGMLWTMGFVGMLENGLRLECPTYATPKLYELMIACWNIHLENRPNFTYIKSLIENIMALGNETSRADVQSEKDEVYSAMF